MSDILMGELSLGVEYYKGATGDSGVFVGDATPTNDANVWIEPDGDISGQIITVEELENKGYMNEEQVRALVEEILNGG